VQWKQRDIARKTCCGWYSTSAGRAIDENRSKGIEQNFISFFPVLAKTGWKMGAKKQLHALAKMAVVRGRM
jgi:hypothetical protein